jgi:hypothetical protein
VLANIKSRLSKLDLLILAGLLLFAITFTVGLVNFTFPPFEDAAMLMRYSQNFSHGYGIVWNIGEAPVDGATDFLFMIVIGLFVKAGLSLEFATRFIGFISQLLTIWIIYLSTRKLFNAPILVSLISALYLTVGPGFFYVAGYFGTTFFALSACINWYFALNLIQNGDDKKYSILFAINSLITTLIRPEGIILTGLMLLAIIYIKGIKSSRHIVLNYLSVFVLIGGIYFLWRWNYFGYPLPNPFYKKGGGVLYPSSLKVSLVYTLFFCLPFCPSFLIGAFYKQTRRLTFGVIIPILGFATAFILLSNEMNIGARFQYVLLPMGLMVWWPITASLRDQLKISEWVNTNKQNRVKIVIPVIMLTIGAMGYIFSIGRTVYDRDGKHDLAIMLSEYKDQGVSLATSEAGLLPLYSELKTLDTWGLNDKWITHNGKITEEYLDKFKPDIIMIHMVYPPDVTNPLASFPIISVEDKTSNWYEKFLQPDTKDSDWAEMAMTVKDYAERNSYILAAAFGTKPNDIDYYYVRSGFPESDEIVNRIRTFKYYMISSGRFAKNYVLP